jgi:hypothetical protein
MATSVEQELRPSPAARIRRARERLSMWTVVAALVPFALAFAVYLLVYLEMRPGTSGDEPHYLMASESIAYDFDVDLTNDYASRERTLRVVNIFPLGPHGAVYTESGELRPYHSVGLSALLAPAVAIGGLTGARLAMVLIAALLADQLYRLLRDLGLRRRYRILAWVAAIFCMPVLAFSSQIYPELPGALLLVVAVRIMIAGAPSPLALVFGSTAAAALVWLHVRYLSLSIGVLLGLAIAACYDRRKVAEGRRDRGLFESVRAAGAAVVRFAAVATKRWRTVALPLLAPYAIGLALHAAAFERWYGTPDPQAPYRAFGSQTIGSGGWDFWYEFALRDLLNPIAGWIPFAPVHWLGFAALGCLVVRFGWPAVAGIAMAAGYELLVASVGPTVGWGFPGRFTMIVVPFIAIPIAVAIQRLRAARVVFVPLLAVSFVFAVAAVRDFLLLYPLDDTQRIFGLRSVAPAFPITHRSPVPVPFAVTPGQVPPQTGRVQGTEAIARAGRDKPGLVLYGPYATLRSGAYRATFPLAASGVGPDDPVATIEVVGQPGVAFAGAQVTGRQLRPRRLSDISLSFATPGGHAIETRIFYHGRGTLRAGPVRVEPIVAAAGPPAHLPNWPLAFLWVAGTALVGWLFVQVMKLTQEHSA